MPEQKLKELREQAVRAEGSGQPVCVSSEVLLLFLWERDWLAAEVEKLEGLLCLQEFDIWHCSREHDPVTEGQEPFWLTVWRRGPWKLVKAGGGSPVTIYKGGKMVNRGIEWTMQGVKDFIDRNDQAPQQSWMGFSSI